jgi:hypothetical protein
VYDHSVPSSPSTPNVEALVPITPPFPIAGLLNSPPGGTLVRVGGLPLYKDESGEGAVATLTVPFKGLVLTSISDFDDFSAHSLDNYDGYPAADNNWTKNFQQQQFSEELRLASDTRGLVDWIVGAEYSQNWFHCRDALDWTFVYGLADVHHAFGQGHHRRELHPDAAVGGAVRPRRNAPHEPLDARHGTAVLARSGKLQTA